MFTTFKRDLIVLRAIHAGVKVGKQHCKLIDQYEEAHHHKHEQIPDYDCGPATTAFYEMLEGIGNKKYSHNAFARVAYTLTREAHEQETETGPKVSVMTLDADAFDGIDMEDQDAVMAKLRKVWEAKQEFERVVSETGEGDPEHEKKKKKGLLDGVRDAFKTNKEEGN